MSSETHELSFATDIRPLFRDKDIAAMKEFFDLSNYQDVVHHSDQILRRLEAGEMPCDEAWPDEQVSLFRDWKNNGMKP